MKRTIPILWLLAIFLLGGGIQCCSVPISQLTSNRWREFKHDWSTGDHGAPFFEPDVQITNEKIQRLRPGISTEEEVCAIFDGEAAVQKTYYRAYPRRYNGKVYTVDRHVAFTEIVPPLEPQADGVNRGWDERIGVRAFFYKNTLQFFRVSHDVRLPGDGIGIGPLETTEDRQVESDRIYCDQELHRLQIGIEPPPSLISIENCLWFEKFMAGELTTEPRTIKVSPLDPAGLKPEEYRTIYPAAWEAEE